MTQQTNLAYVKDVTDNDLRLTPAARAKMAELLKEADPGLGLIRIFVTGGGCGGMSYGMTYGEGITEYDSMLEGTGYKIAIDPVALNFLQGSEIDFANDSFIFNNVFKSIGGTGTCGGCGGGKGF